MGFLTWASGDNITLVPNRSFKIAAQRGHQHFPLALRGDGGLSSFSSLIVGMPPNCSPRMGLSPCEHKPSRPPYAEGEPVYSIPANSHEKGASDGASILLNGFL